MDLPKILIVDNVTTNLVALRSILSKVDGTVVEARSGRQVLELIVKEDFALILLDIETPDMNGFEVAEIVGSIESCRHIPIIFVSAAFTDPDLRRKAYEAGAIDFIQMPIEEGILVSKVRLFLELFKQRQQLEAMRVELEARVNESTADLRRTQKIARVGGWSANFEENSYRICDNARDLFFPDTSKHLVTAGMKGSFLTLMPRPERSRISEIIRKAAETKELEVEFEFQYFDSARQSRTAYSYANLAYKEDVLFEIQGAVQDITERKEAEGRLNYVATHDALTGLPNRYLFRDRLDQAFLRATRTGQFVSVMLIDIDHFKDINDSLGHPVGDGLLSEFGRRLSEIARASDTVARLGGDEFAIICAELTHPEDAIIFAQRCIDAMKETFHLDDNMVQSGCSIGISSFPEDGIRADEIIKFADLALYHSKTEGRGNFHLYNVEMSEKLKQRKELEERLAIALGRLEFELYYQPKVDLRTRAVTGVEALIRWQHPTEGLIMPMDFIPLAEKTDLIHDLGEWVIRDACQTATKWSNQYGDQIKIAVNVSAVQFRSDGFVDLVRRILEEEETPGELLEIEITESAILKNPQATQLTLDEIRLMGITVALDDFGTGYSSLTHLKYLRASTLKIDRSFISNIMDDQYDQHIAEKMIELAQNLNMLVVAEGVETEDQMRKLIECGCDIGQGYLFSRPLPEDDFLDWLEKYEAITFKSPAEAAAANRTQRTTGVRGRTRLASNL